MAEDYWIQGSIRHKGRVTRYVERCYGSKAFTERGTLKQEYLAKAEKRARMMGNTSLVDAINEARTLKRLRA
jgi:hypothetical protein